MGRAVAFRALAIAYGLVLAVAALEVAFWLLAVEPPKLRTKRLLTDQAAPRVAYHCYDSNPSREFRKLPDTATGRWRLRSYMLPPRDLPLFRLRETPWCVEYRKTPEMLRDREYEGPPAPGVLRIAMVGDSFAYGEGVPIERTLFRQLEERLGKGFEVLNLARPALDTRGELAMLRKLAGRFHLRRAIVVFVPNDVELSATLARRQAYINDLINIRDEYLTSRERRAWYTGHLRVLRFVGSELEMRRIERATVEWYLDAYDARHNAKNLAALAGYFRALAALGDCRVVLVLYPLMHGLESDYPLSAIHARVAAMGREAGLPVLDLATAFARQATRSLQVHPTDHHPNGTAHRIAAETIADWLRRDVPEFLQVETSAR